MRPSKIFRIYPLSQKDNPPKMTFSNVSGKFNNTIHRMDYGYWEELNSQIQDETARWASTPTFAACLRRLASRRVRKFAPDDEEEEDSRGRRQRSAP